MGHEPLSLVTYGMRDAISAAVMQVDERARAIELKWGCGRLQRLVGADLAERFLLQQRKLNEAVWAADIEGVRVQAAGMLRAYDALEAMAVQLGSEPLDPQVWEARLDDGRVLMVARTDAEAWVQAARNRAAGRECVLYSLEQIAGFISLPTFDPLNAVLATFPGSVVDKVTRLELADPLDDIA